MRMEELSDGRYIKNPDTVERYLLNLVQDYFNSSNIASPQSKEYIIQKAVERMKEEITFDNIGVLSITLPNGDTKTGSVSISLEDLNGEPLIYPKLSAFNVNFGTEAKTACEGNDPRLSDARKPLEHTHEIDEVIGLKGALSSLTGKIDRVDGLVHSHLNKNVLDVLVYTGNKDSIDLIALETLEHKVTTDIDAITQGLLEYSKETNTKINEINNKYSETETYLENLQQNNTNANDEYLSLAKQYTDDSINDLNTFINTELNQLTTKELINNALSSATNSFALAGTMTFNLSDILDFTLTSKQLNAIINVNAEIITKLTNIGQTLQDCQITPILQYAEASTGNTVYGTLPFVIISDGAINGYIQSENIYSKNQIALSIAGFSNVPDEIKNAKIIYNIYAKQTISLI